MERETGLEPATPCLEGRSPFQRPLIKPPLWRKVTSHARSRAAVRKPVGRVTVNEPNQGAVYTIVGPNATLFSLESWRVFAHLWLMSQRFLRVSHSFSVQAPDVWRKWSLRCVLAAGTPQYLRNDGKLHPSTAELAASFGEFRQAG